MSGYRKDFDETKSMSFSIKDDELLKRHNEIWEKVENIIKNSYNGKISTNFHNNKIPKDFLVCQ